MKLASKKLSQYRVSSERSFKAFLFLYLSLNVASTILEVEAKIIAYSNLFIEVFYFCCQRLNTTSQVVKHSIFFAHLAIIVASCLGVYSVFENEDKLELLIVPGIRFSLNIVSILRVRHYFSKIVPLQKIINDYHVLMPDLLI